MLEKIVGFFVRTTGVPGVEQRKLQVRAVDAVRYLHQADKVDWAFDAIQLAFVEAELLEQKRVISGEQFSATSRRTASPKWR